MESGHEQKRRGIHVAVSVEGLDMSKQSVIIT